MAKNPLESILKDVLQQLPADRLGELSKNVKVAHDWSIAMFNPHPKQNAFHRSGAHIRLFQGGNRSGKSTSGCKEAVAFCLGYRPWYSKADNNYFTPLKAPTKGRIICEDFSATASKVIVEKLFEDIPPNMIEKGYPKKNSDGVEVNWRLTNGSTFQIMTNKQDDKLFEGADLDWCWYDEPPERNKFIATQRGMVDRGGYAWMTMTPLSQPWIYDEIQAMCATDPDYFMVTVDIMDNVGYGLEKENIDRYAKSLREDEKDMRLHGKPRRLIGLIYDTFSHKDHVIEPFNVPRKWPRFVMIDPHPRTPHMVSWFTVDPYGRLIQYDEFFEHLLISELSQVIKTKTGSDRIMFYACDPIAFNDDPVTDKSWSDKFRESGIPVTPAVKDLTNGILAVKDALKGTMGYPNLYFFRTLYRTIWEIQRYRWAEWKGSSEDRNAKEKPVDKDDHAMENLYRAVLMQPPYKDMDSVDQELPMPPPDVP